MNPCLQPAPISRSISEVHNHLTEATVFSLIHSSNQPSDELRPGCGRLHPDTSPPSPASHGYDDHYHYHH